MQRITFLTVAIILSLLASPKLFAETSGKCGDDITWTLDDNGNLKLEGTGDMYNRGYELWGKSINTVSMSYGITSIGQFSFLNCTKLKVVEIPNSVVIIDLNSFNNCSNLINIEIPNSVTTLENGAFYNCNRMTNVVIGTGVKKIAKNAFRYCEKLNKITCHAVEPPICQNWAFENVDKANCVLEVPAESVEKYKTADEWKDFLNISGVESIADDSEISVITENGKIIINGAEDNTLVEIFNTKGETIYTGTDKSVKVPSGSIYLVRTSGKTYKVAVR